MRFSLASAVCFFFIGVCLLFSSCRQRNKSVSFYYWRTSFYLDGLEKEALYNNAVQTLYTRYFDIDFLPGSPGPEPVAPISFYNKNPATAIVPIIFIKNRVFEHLDAAAVNALSQKTYQLVKTISSSLKTKPVEIQFDCDWTENTRNNYFLFLRQYKMLSSQKLGATIRLHQIKYAGRTGIPPVDYGILMYYNMGDIDAGASSSIYDPSIAAKYNPAIKSYPLVLDICPARICLGPAGKIWQSS